jgi:hypothetical protein
LDTDCTTSAAANNNAALLRSSPSIATKLLIISNANYIVSKNATLIKAARQLKLIAVALTSLPALRILFNKQIAFFFARSSACFRIFLLRIKRNTTLANNALSTSTFFAYSLQV